MTVESITPLTASPILARELVIKLANSYPTSGMTVDDFKADSAIGMRGGVWL